jgi:hypothetical protein
VRSPLIPVRCLPARPAARWAGGLVLLALGLGGPLATEASLPRRVALRCDLLVMGMGGTRQLATRRIVLEPGMGGRVLFSTPAGSSGREGPTSVSLTLATGVTAAGRMSIELDGTVIEEAPDAPRTWQIRRQVDLIMGSSALVELAPPDAAGQRLALSLTAAAAADDEAVDAARVRIDMNVEVAVVDGEEASVLEHPYLRSLSGETVTFAVDYQVPTEDGRTFENVHLDLELTPGYLRGDRLPLELSISGGFPGPDGVVLSSRTENRLLARGEIWEMAIRPADDEGLWLRVRLIAGWRLEGETGGPGGS